MPSFQRFNILKSIYVGGIAGLLAYLMTIIFKYFTIPVFNYKNEWLDFTASSVKVDLRDQILSTGYYKDIGTKVLDFLQANLQFSMTEFVAVIAASIVIYLGGRFAVAYFGARVKKIAVVLSFAIGGVIAALISASILGFPIGTLVASALIYGLAIGIVMQIIVALKPFRFLAE